MRSSNNARAGLTGGWVRLAGWLQPGTHYLLLSAARTSGHTPQEADREGEGEQGTITRRGTQIIREGRTTVDIDVTGWSMVTANLVTAYNPAVLPSAH